MSLNRGSSKGWVLLEVFVVSIVVAYVLAMAHKQQNELDQQLQTLIHKSVERSQAQFQQQAKTLFEVDLILTKTPPSMPVCRRCQAGALRSLLHYELNQWP